MTKQQRAIRDACKKRDDQIAVLKRQILDQQEEIREGRDEHQRILHIEQVRALDLAKEVDRYRSLHYALLRYLLLINYDPANPPA